MKKELKHLIKNLQLDLLNADQENKIERSEIIRSKIIPITERLLQEWADENTHDQLDQLEIDLGTIPLDEFMNSLPDAYEKRIKDTLDEMFVDKKTEHPQMENQPLRTGSLLDRFIFYLKDGYLDQSIQPNDFEMPDDILVELLNSDKEKLKAALEPLLVLDHAVNRLVGAMQIDTLDLLLAELAFADAATQAMLLIGELARFNHLKELHLSRRQIAMAVYRQALRRAAKNQVIFSGKSVARIFHQLFHLQEMKLDEWLQYMQQFSDYAQQEKFLSQFIDLSEQLKKFESPSISINLLIDEGKQENERNNQLTEQCKNTPDMPDECAFTCNITNAGLILLYPNFERVFEALGWTENNQFVSETARFKAVLITDYLVRGDQELLHEHELILNKIICDMHPREAINPQVRLSEKEKEDARELLSASINNWRILRNSSREDYRYSFLKRKGVLIHIKGDWHLKVVRKKQDVLLETLPFTIDKIELPWMKNKLLVDW